MKALCQIILTEHERLWMSRNKRGGFEASIERFKKLEIQVNDNLVLLDKNGLSRWANRSLEKIVSAAGVLYLK